MQTLEPAALEELSDFEKLDRILLMTQNVLAELVRAREVLFSQSLRTYIESSWGDVLPAFYNLTGLIRENETSLAAIGLSGNNLNLKYQGIFESYERLNQRGGLRRAKDFLKWAKIVLGTLTTIVPYLKEAAEIIKEYMEAVEKGIEDAESNY